MAKKPTTRRRTSSSQGEVHRPARHRGLGIALKFAIPISLFIAALVSSLGWILYDHVETALNEDIDRAGVFAAKALAAPDWAIADNTKRLRGMLTDKVEEVAIWELRGNKVALVATATGAKALPITRYKGSRNLDDVLVERGLIETKNDRKVTYRSFRHAITNPENDREAIGFVQVFLSEEAIENDLNAISRFIIVFCLLGITLGIALCFFVAGRITTPIKALISDISEVARGRLDHRTRVRTRDEVGVLANAFNEMTQGLEDGMRAKKDLSSKEHQEHIAQEIQEKLFPKTLPDLSGMTLDAVFESGHQISGDLFDVLPLGENRTGMLLMTASGHGVPAAIILAMARSVYRAVALDFKDSPAGALKRINALFSPDLRRGMYVTAIYAIVDAETGMLRVASAGHKMPMLHYVRARDSLSRVHPGGIAMGLDTGPIFDRSLQEAEVQGVAGDEFVLSTSGILDFRLSGGEPLGEQRFFKAVFSTAKSGTSRLAHQVLARIQAHADDEPEDVDITIVSLRIGAED